MGDLSHLNFNANEEEELKDYAIVPKGDYVAMATSSEMKPSKKGHDVLNFRWDILEGPQAGRVVFSAHNINNPNDTSRKIARQELAAICKATGVHQPEDTSELCNIAILIKVDHETYVWNGEEKTKAKIKNWKRLDEVSKKKQASKKHQDLPPMDDEELPF